MFEELVMSCPFGLESCKHPYYCSYVEFEAFHLSWPLPLCISEGHAQVVRPNRFSFRKSVFIGVCGEEQVYACKLPSGTYREVDEGWHEGYDEHGVWEEFEVHSVRDCIARVNASKLILISLRTLA
ncbi:MAG: hypothetical protein F6J93_35595 [Oscillatoria sp. SIO1A7]|nr:hypothetical protein [Oscillatoria sp. SIO1A7]